MRIFNLWKATRIIMEDTRLLQRSKVSRQRKEQNGAYLAYTGTLYPRSRGSGKDGDMLAVESNVNMEGCCPEWHRLRLDKYENNQYSKQKRAIGPFGKNFRWHFSVVLGLPTQCMKEESVSREGIFCQRTVLDSFVMQTFGLSASEGGL